MLIISTSLIDMIFVLKSIESGVVGQDQIIDSNSNAPYKLLQLEAKHNTNIMSINLQSSQLSELLLE